MGTICSQVHNSPCLTSLAEPSRTMARPKGAASHCGVSTKLVLLISAVVVLAPACESLSSRPGHNVGGLGGWQPPTPLLETVAERTAVIFRDIDSVRVGQRNMHGGGVAVRIGFETTTGSLASAVPVAADGYFLTAGHAVHPHTSSLILVAITRERGTLRAVKAAARVVWPLEGVTVSEPLDIAVVHADLPPLVPFDIATVGDLRSDILILAAGWKPLWDMASEDITAGRDARPIAVSKFVSAGRILAMGETRGGTAPDDPRFRVVRHDAPVGPGDSGGGIVDAHGRLIGVNVRTRVCFLRRLAALLAGLAGNLVTDRDGYSADAIWLDSDWLARVIEQDRDEGAHRGGRGDGAGAQPGERNPPAPRYPPRPSVRLPS